MPQINYSLRIGPKFDMFGLEKTNPNNPIIVSDNLNSEFSLSQMEYNDTSSYIKEIKSITTSARRTRIVGNTTDLYMTDIFNSDDEPLFYKVIKRKLHKPKIYINGEPAEYVDNSFIYLNNNTALVEYYSQDDELILSEYREVYPVFIWQEQINHQDIIDMDNKKYYFKLSAGDVVVSASKPNVFARVDVEPVYTLKRIKNDTVLLPPFYLETLRSNESGRLSFEYDYMTIVPDVTKRRLEQIALINDDTIILENIDIIKESVVLYKRKNYEYIIDETNIDDDYKDYDVVLDNTNKEYDNIIDSQKGEIAAETLLRENIIEYDDILYISYQYVRTNNILRIESEDVDLKNKKIHFIIKPTKIKKPGVSLTFPPELTYLITDLDGNISLIKDDTIPEYVFELPLYLGYGEGVFWGPTDPQYPLDPELDSTITGYSGTTNDFKTIVINGSGLGTEYGTGWGDLGYGEGPFGGSFLKSIEDIKNLLDIKNNSESGLITIGTLTFESKIKSANIFPYKDVSMVDAEMGRKMLYNYNNVVWHSSLGDHSDNIIKKISTDIIHTDTTIYFEPYIQFQDEDSVTVEFDLLKISKLYNSSGNIKEEYVLTNTVSPVANGDVDIYNNIMPSVDNKITDITAFTFKDGKHEKIENNIYISSDFLKATMLIDKTISTYSNVGLGFMNQDIKIHPSLTIKL